MNTWSFEALSSALTAQADELLPEARTRSQLALLVEQYEKAERLAALSRREPSHAGR